jgi:phosphate-selective porin
VSARPRPFGPLLASLALALPAAAQQGSGAAPSGWQTDAFSLSNKAAGFEIALTGYIQADFRSFQDWQVGDGTDPTARLEDGLDWRRLRVGFEGEWRKLRFEFDVDPAFDEGEELKDAWLGVRFARELELRGGHMKLPVSHERLQSASRTDLIERATVVNALAPDRDWGGLAHGELGRRLEWNVGVFEGDGSESRSRAGTTAAARLVLTAGALELGASFAQGDVEEVETAVNADARPQGLRGVSGTGFEFFPAVFVNGTRRRWAADARLSGGPVAVWGEFLEAREERLGQGPTLEDLPQVQGRGFSTTATWLVTGERKTRRMRPRQPLFGGPGAVELVVRYEELWFDDVSNQGFESAGSRAANIRPAGIRAFTGGMNWWPNRLLRLSGNVLVERYTDALRAPEPGREGDYVSLLGRIQVSLP